MFIVRKTKLRKFNNKTTNIIVLYIKNNCTLYYYSKKILKIWVPYLIKQ